MFSEPVAVIAQPFGMAGEVKRAGQRPGGGAAFGDGAKIEDREMFHESDVGIPRPVVKTRRRGTARQAVRTGRVSVSQRKPAFDAKGAD